MLDTIESLNTTAGIFSELLNERIWVVSGQNKAPCNSSGEPFSNWSDPNAPLMIYAEALAVADKFDLPNIGIIFPATGIVRDGHRLLCIDGDEVSGYRKCRKDKPGKPGCSAIKFNPATDADTVLAKVPLVALLPDTVWEASVSLTSFHGFLWLREDQAAPYWGRRGATLEGCDHVDTFIAGRKPAHLIVTGTLLTDCATIAKLDDITLLKPILQPAGDPKGAPELLISNEGTPIDLTALDWLSEEQRILVTVIGKYKIDRSQFMNGLLIKLIDKHIAFADIFASLCANDATRDYLLDHRNQDPIRAMEFARYEIGSAYPKSDLYSLHRLARYYPAWADGEQLVDPKATAPQTLLCESLPDFLATRKDPVWMLEGILKRGVHIGVLGHPNAGKTAVMLEVLLRMALGWVFGKRQTEQVHIVYLAGEDPEGIQLRILLWCQENDVKPEQLRKWFTVIRRPVLYDQDQTVNLIAELDVLHATSPIGVIAVDTFSANYGGDNEDKATDVMKWFRMIRQDFIAHYGCSVLTMHHPPKGSLDVFNWCGSSAAARELDNMWGIVRVGDTITWSLGIHRGGEFEPIHFKKKVLPLDGCFDNFDNPVTSVTVALTNSPGVDMTEALICMAINTQTGLKKGKKFTHPEIAMCCNMNPKTVTKWLGKMKVKTAERGRLVKESTTGVLSLTDEGDNMARMSQVDPAALERARKGVYGEGENDGENE